jgi:uncharacterized hydrophobic protein (TIGR00271 family)
LLRHRLTQRARTDALRRVFLNGQPDWASAFAVMLLLAAGIASFGLSQDSAATVIGSMVIAPLGQPMVALGAALVMGWARETGRLLTMILLGAVAVTAVAFLLGVLLPDATPTGQILARTAPDLRDLGVALLAGAAGAYAYVRDELSGVLPGVAIAVALVPPLATVGLMLEERHWVLARGALTLFTANLVGITVAAGVVMLATGFAPRPRLKRLATGPIAGVLAGVTALVLICIPLGRAYTSAWSAAQEATQVHAAVADAIDLGGPAVSAIDISDGSVDLTLEAGTAVDVSRIEDAVRSIMGPDTTVTVARSN